MDQQKHAEIYLICGDNHMTFVLAILTSNVPEWDFCKQATWISDMRPMR